jgi:hypothetical protein
MATIKLQNGKVITKDGKVSCECCEDEDCTEDYQEYSESYGYDVCPDALGAPCFPPGTGSCAGLTITGELISKEFSNSCKENKCPKADVSAYFDDFGYIGSLSCDRTASCNSCGVSGTITPIVEDVGNGKFVLKIPFQATNAYWGGPYSINCSATFYFETCGSSSGGGIGLSLL